MSSQPLPRHGRARGEASPSSRPHRALSTPTLINPRDARSDSRSAGQQLQSCTDGARSVLSVRGMAPGSSSGHGCARGCHGDAAAAPRSIRPSMMRSPRLLLRFGAELGSTALCAQSADLPCRSRTMGEAEHHVDCERVCRDAEIWSPDWRPTIAGARRCGLVRSPQQLHSPAEHLRRAGVRQLSLAGEKPRWWGLLIREMGPVGRGVAGMTGPRRDVATRARVG